MPVLGHVFMHVPEHKHEYVLKDMPEYVLKA